MLDDSLIESISINGPNRNLTIKMQSGAVFDPEGDYDSVVRLLGETPIPEKPVNGG
jgi:hypothetical protein